MHRPKSLFVYLLMPILLGAAVMAQAPGQTPEEAKQSAAARPAAKDATAKPDKAATTPAAVVIEVAGSVDWAKPGVSPLTDDGWTKCQLEDTYEPGIRIRTGLRSHVNLFFGKTTVVSIRSATFASIDQFYKSATTETVRVGLAYGTVRGGSTEGPVKADVQVDSTVATLSKRGTEGWQMWVEPMSGKFRVSLAESGLVEVAQKLAAGRARTKQVRPGEYATAKNMANLWIDQARFDDTVRFYSAETITSAELDFEARSSGADAYQTTTGGYEAYSLSRRAQLQPRGRNRLANLPPTAVLVPQPITRPEGNFGNPTTFRVLRPVTGR